MSLSEETKLKLVEYINSDECPTYMLPVYRWWLQRRAEQTCPDPVPKGWFLLGGRGSGKTWCASNYVYEFCATLPWEKENDEVYVGLVGATFEDVKLIMVEGKALALDTLVSTPQGFIPIGELVTGDIVYGGDGIPCTVTNAWPARNNRPCYEVTFKGGVKVIADEDHNWVTKNYFERRDNKNPSVRTTKELHETLRHFSGGASQANHAVPVSFIAGLEKEVVLPIDPYMLGAWLGDGRSRSGEITSADPEILEQFDSVGFKTRKQLHSKYQYSILGFTKYLRANNLINNKHVPEEYFYASYKQRLSLLQGLMDTDGYVSERGQCEFSNKNAKLIDAVIRLSSSLGIKPSTPRPKNGSFIIKFTTELPVFRLTRKLNRIPNKYRDSDYWFIQDIQPVESVPVRCISVDSPDNTYLITKHNIKTHNSGLLKVIPEENLINWNRTSGELKFWIIDGENKRKIIINTYTAERPEKLRGPDTHLVWMDEPAKFKDADVDPDKPSTTWNNMILGLRGGKHPHVIITGTPTRCKLVRYLDNRDDVKQSAMTTLDNRDNLPESYVNELLRLPKNSAAYRQEVLGQIIYDNPDSLFAQSTIDEYRWIELPEEDEQTKFMKVLGYDPSASSSASSDECGIILVGYTPEVKQATSELGGRPIVVRPTHAYVLDDLSGHYTPKEQTSLVIQTMLNRKVDDLVFEQNQGVEFVLDSLKQAIQEHTMDFKFRPGRKAKKTDYGIVKSWQVSGIDMEGQAFRFNIYAVHATQGKTLRAETVSIKYDSGQVHHPQELPMCEIKNCGAHLETQMTSWDPETSKKSPDRLDAMAYCMLHIFSGTLLTRNKVTIARPPSDINQMTSKHGAVKGNKARAGIYSMEVKSTGQGENAERSLVPFLDDPYDILREMEIYGRKII